MIFPSDDLQVLIYLYFSTVGDLGRYRIAIEDNKPKDREVWSNVARFWYDKAADKSPHIRRLYHHLAILARPYTIEQLSLYLRSLTCVTPFESRISGVIRAYMLAFSFYMAYLLHDGLFFSLLSTA